MFFSYFQEESVVIRKGWAQEEEEEGVIIHIGWAREEEDEEDKWLIGKQVVVPPLTCYSGNGRWEGI